MKLIIGGKYYSTLDAQTVQIRRSATDPVPTCTLNLIDNASTLNIQNAAELLVLDDQVTPNPTINLARGPDMNPYTAQWGVVAMGGPPTGVTLSTNVGGGVIFTFANTAAASPTPILQQSVIFGQIQAGQTYIFSAYVQGGSTPTNIGASIFVVFRDAGLNTLSTLTFNGPVPTLTSLTRYTVSGVAPAGAVSAILQFGFQTSSATNSGTITFTQAQMEPEWFPTLSYPTPWCGPAQTNCQQLPLGFWIRQYRKFAGFITRVWPQNYHGNVRTIQVDASGYAWICSLIFCNNSFTSQTDAAIITSLANTYLVNSGLLIFSVQATLVSLTNVVTGVTVASLQSNWDDLRTLFDSLCGLSGFIWTIDYYWNLIYVPPGYLTQNVALICDNSGPPNGTTTFPGYEFSAEYDFTQPGSTILVLGSSTNVSLVSDPAQIAQLGYTSGYYLTALQSWMRKVNDSSLANTTDTTNRGLIELLLYDKPRSIYHVKTQVELIPGESIQVTSATDGLSNTTLLVQQITAVWKGTDAPLTDVWEYQNDLGALSRLATHLLSRIFRVTQKGTSAPAIASTTLAILENTLGIAESAGTALAAALNYLAAVMLDAPSALYPFNEIAGGTIADDYSGNANTGTAAGGITQGATGLLTDAADSSAPAWTFNGSTGIVTLPTAVNGNGLSAWTVEVWCSLSTGALGSVTAIVACGPGTNTVGFQLFWSSTTAIQWIVGTGASSATASFSVTATAGVTFHLVGTYDGTQIQLFVNGVRQAVTALTGAISSSTNAPTIGAYNNSTHFFPGTIQWPALYSTTLAFTKIVAHYLAGTTLYGYQVSLIGAIRYYRLGEASGTSAQDYGSNALSGTYTGGFTLAQTGLIFNDVGKSVSLNGSTGFVSLPITALPTGSSSVSFGAWVSPAAAGAGDTMVMYLGNSTNGQFIYLAMNSSRQFYVSNGTVGTTVSSAVTLSTTHFVVAVWDGSKLYCYVDGSLNGGAGTSTTLTMTYGTAKIGATNGATNFWNGKVQEAFIVSGVLSQAQITALNNMGTLGHL